MELYVVVTDVKGGINQLQNLTEWKQKKEQQLFLEPFKFVC